LGGAGLIAILHLPGVVQQVIGGVPDDELDGPVARRWATRVVVPNRGTELLPVSAERLRILLCLDRRGQADLPREVTDLDVVDMLDDSVTLASSSPRALPELRGHARGDVVEVGPARPEKGDLALAVSVAHLFLFGS